MRMNEDKSIYSFNIKLREIANNYFALGEKMSEDKMVRKILRYLPYKFDMKVTTIKKAQDLRALKVDELIGSLQTLEVSLNGRSKKKIKGIYFVSNTQEDKVQSNKDTEEDLLENITYVGRKFHNFLRRLDRYWMTNVQDIKSDIGSLGKILEEDKDKEVRCFECEGFGHIKTECPNFQKKQKKGFTIIRYESYDESEGETANKMMPFIGSMSQIILMKM